jgi:sec-independent protein translocase protein TatC
MEDGGGSEMPLLAHLSELRKRLLVSIVAIVATTILAFLFSDSILRILLMPMKNQNLKAFNLLDGFMIRWRLSLFAGIIVASPIWTLQIYKFIRPALHEQEKNAIGPMLVCVFFLFLAGMAFAFYLLFMMVTGLLSFFPAKIEYLPSADDYISFVTFFMVACGVVFELPPFLIILVRLRILQASKLRAQRRIAYFILFAFAEIITPVSDPIVAPLTVMVPLVLLYEVSILFASRIDRKRTSIEATRLDDGLKPKNRHQARRRQ